MYVVVPLITLGLYLLVVLVGQRVAEELPAFGVVIMLLPVLSLLLTTGTQLANRHRGWCLVRRSVSWWLRWPGLVVIGLAGA